MITAISASIAAFIATGIDELIVLTVIFAKMRAPRNVRDVYIGQELAMIVLLAISLLVGRGIAAITQEWVGILGIIPIAIGIKVAIVGESDTDDSERTIMSNLAKRSSLVVGVALIAIGGGAEELSVYIPFFASLSGAELVAAVATFLILVPVWCAFCRKISKLPHLEDTVEKYERIIIPVFFIAIGFFVLAENHTIPTLLALFD
ncbi:MAG: cadmium resistance protein CadD [Actinobacteria bacterium]|nr:cadmium resistance protein CadD [Actinomycetota bacterium]